jgi:hypothetical protein
MKAGKVVLTAGQPEHGDRPATNAESLHSTLSEV